jgi:hypothetical protein
METNLADDPAIISIVGRAAPLAAKTRHITIVDAAGYTAAGEYLKEIKTSLAEIEEARVRITKPMLEAQREANAQAKAAAAPFVEIEARVKAGLLEWNRECERRRVENQRRQDEIARKERERLQAIADAARAKAAEEARLKREEADRIFAEDAAKAAALRASAVKIEDKAEAKADRFEDRAASTVAVVVATETAKVAGVSQRKRFTYRIRDAAQVNAAYLMPDEPKIGKLVRALGREAQDLVGPGVEIYEESLIASGKA